MRYQPDAIWDAATWAEIDQAVAEEVKRVSVVRRAFRTGFVMAADGTAPSWISGAAVQIHGAGATARIYIPEGDAPPVRGGVGRLQAERRAGGERKLPPHG